MRHLFGGNSISWRILLLALALVAPCLSRGQAKLSETYLVQGRTRNDAVLLFYDGYIKVEYAEVFDKAREKGIPEDKLLELLDTLKVKMLAKKLGLPEETAKKDYPDSRRGRMRFNAERFGKLDGFVKAGDGGAAVPCVVKDGAITDFDAKSHVPLVVLESGNGALVEERLDHARIEAADWRNYFHDGEEDRDPFVRTVWFTTWDNISNRWDALLKEPNGRNKVRDQMREIEESGRYGQPGGETWRKRIWNYYVGKADLAPQVEVVNKTGRDCTLRVVVMDASGMVTAGGEMGLLSNERKSEPVPAVPESFSNKARAIAELTAKGECPRCWKGVGEVNVGAYDGVVRLEVEKPAPKDAYLSVTIQNAPGDVQAQVVFRPDGGGADTDLMKIEDDWECRVPAHAKGSVIVKAGKSEGAVVVPQGDLHGGETVRLEVNVTDPRPSLREGAAPSFPPGTEPDCLAAVTIDRDYAVFDGKAEDYANERELARLARAEGGTIPVKVSFSGQKQKGGTPNLPSFVTGMLPGIIGKGPRTAYVKETVVVRPAFEFKQEGEEFHLVLTPKPKEGTWTRVPSNTFYAVTWNDIRKKLGELAKDPGNRAAVRALIGEIRQVKPAWGGLIDDFVNANPELQPRVTFKNETGKVVLLVIGSDAPVALQAGQPLEKPFGEVSGKNLRVREVGFLDEEYTHNQMPLSDKVSDDITVTIKPSILDHREKPRIYVDAPPNVVKGVEIKYADSANPVNGRYALGYVEVEAHEKIDWLKFSCNGYDPVTIPLWERNTFLYGDEYKGLSGKLNDEIQEQIRKRKKKAEEEKIKGREREIRDRVNAEDFTGARKVVADTKQDPSFSDEWRRVWSGQIDAGETAMKDRREKTRQKESEIREKISAKDFAGAGKVLEATKSDLSFTDEWRRDWNMRIREGEIEEKINAKDFFAARIVVADTKKDPFFSDEWRSRWSGQIKKAEEDEINRVPDLPGLEKGENAPKWRRNVKKALAANSKDGLQEVFTKDSSTNKHNIPQQTLKHIEKCDGKCGVRHEGASLKEKALMYLFEGDKDMVEKTIGFWTD